MNRPVCRPAERPDFPALRNLWQEAFGDPEEITNQFFDLAFARDRSLILEVEGAPAAGLYWLPASFGIRRVAYLYAVAVSRAFRGQGFGSLLIQRACDIMESQGYEGVLLSPSEEGLFWFYGRLGFIPCCKKRRFCDLPVGTVLSPGEYESRRQAFLQPEDAVLSGPGVALFGESGGFFAFPGGVYARDDRKIVEAFGPGVETEAGETFAAMYRPLTGDTAMPETFSMFLD